MSACTRAEYQAYLENNPYIHTMTQEEYSEFKAKEDARPLWKRLEEKFFATIEKMLPESYKSYADYLHLAFIVSRCRVSYHLSNPRTATAVSACAIAVFFCPNAQVSVSELYCALAYIGYMRQSTAP